MVHDEYDTLVRVLDEKGVLNQEELKTYLPDADVRAERDQWRELFLENVLRIIHQEIEGVKQENQSEKDYQQSIDYVENN